jgi:small subunit ribosomal protein S5
LAYKYRISRGDREEEKFNIEAWQPKTRIGELVKSKQIVSIEQIFESGKTIKEVEIIDALFPNLENRILEVTSVQRMTKNGRRPKYRATVVVGDNNGHVGVGSAKDGEVKPAIDSAMKDAKKKMIAISFGCGSWECNCGMQHSLPLTVRGKCGSAEIILKPAPRGVGVVAGKVAREVLEVTGIKDVWSFSRGRTRDIYNFAIATYLALRQVSKLKNIEKLKVVR